MPDPTVETLIDHQASLQTQLNALRLELLAWALTSVALAVLVAILAWKVSHL
jgi:hypothetical protein